MVSTARRHPPHRPQVFKKRSVVFKLPSWCRTTHSSGDQASRTGCLASPALDAGAPCHLQWPPHRVRHTRSPCTLSATTHLVTQAGNPRAPAPPALHPLHHLLGTACPLCQRHPGPNHRHPSPRPSQLPIPTLDPSVRRLPVYPAGVPTPALPLLPPLFTPLSAPLALGVKANGRRVLPSSGNPRSAQKPTWTLRSHLASARPHN